MRHFAIVVLLLIPSFLNAQSRQIAALAEEKEQIKSIIDSLESRLVEIDAELTQVDPKAKAEAMITKYGKNKGRMIAAGSVWSSISFEMAIDSWGEPSSIQKSVVSSGETQKWIYPDNKYLFFKNGRLESWKQ